jgi:CRP/FNR family transcriptional regulator
MRLIVASRSPQPKLGQTLLKAATAEPHPLQSCPICSGLGSDALASIAGIAKERKLEKGQYLAQEGEKCTGFYLILSGKLRIFKTAPSGKERVVLMATRGMTFGENALFGDGYFLENACAVEAVRALHVPRKEFLEMLRHNPDLALQVMESLCLWIRRLSSSVDSIAFLGAHDKVVRYFLEQAATRGGISSNTALIQLGDKKRAIADQLGITPETFSRVLRKLESRSLISVEKRAITLTDLQALRGALAGD